MDEKILSINELRHPFYVSNEINWFKWRLSSVGGTLFLRKYLVQLSKREDDEDFRIRRDMSYVPAFAKKSLSKIKNSIFRRMGDVTRAGGPSSYQEACKGSDIRGVDLKGSSMNTFLGRDILPELLPMAKVGVYVDMPPLTGPTVAEKGSLRPYLYFYRAESIRSWSYDPYGDPTAYTALLLEDSDFSIDTHWSLPYDMVARYRLLWVDPDDGYVNVRFYNQGLDDSGKSIIWRSTEPIKLTIRRIPFVVFELSDSLIADASDYQIALMNLTSTDLMYALKSNYPFYTEQVDWRTESPHLRQGSLATFSSTSFDPTTLETFVTQDQARTIRVGASSGRQYPKDLDRPGFIHPSSEPLKISMEKEEQMKREIEELVTNSLASLAPNGKPIADEDSLSSGLHYIALTLEQGERKIADYWAMYEGGLPATINYPEDFSLLTDEERRKHAEFLKELMPHIPSLSYQREVAKQIIRETVAHKVDAQTLNKMLNEVDSAPVVYGDPKVIASDLQQGLVSLDTASKARGYPPGEVEKAKVDHAERLARIAISQTKGEGPPAMIETGSARGVPDEGANPNAGKEEKFKSQKVTDQDENPDPDKTRGEGKAND